MTKITQSTKVRTPEPPVRPEAPAGPPPGSRVDTPATEVLPPSGQALDQALDQKASSFARGSEVPASGQRAHNLRAALAAGDDNGIVDRALKVADDTFDTLESAFLYTNPPSEPGASTAPDKSLEVGIDERTASATVATRSHSVSASLDRFGLNVDATRHDAEHSVNLGGFVMKDWVSAWLAGGVSHADGSATGWDVGPYLDPTGGGIAATLSRKCVDGTVYRVGGFGGGNAGRALTDLGPYDGERPELKGLRSVELTRDLSADLTATPGMVLASVVGIGGRLGVAKSSSLRYRTHLPPARARELLFEDGNKVVRTLRDNARAVGLKDEPLPPPDLSKLAQLKIGDRVTLTTSGSFNGGLAVSAPGGVGTLSVLGAVSGEFELSVERPGPDQLDVTVAPTRVRGLELAGHAVVLDASVAHARARSLSQRFRFDLREPAAVAAYQALLRGELPGGGASRDVDAAPGARAGAEALPAGVSRGPTEQIQGSGWRSHADIGFTLLTLGTTVDRTRWQREVDLGEVRLHEDTRRVEKKLTVPLSGDETRSVRASVLQVSRYQDGQRVATEFARLRLVACVEDSRARGLELNRDIEDLNQAFGLSIKPFTEDSLKKARSIELTCELDAADLEQLAGFDGATVRAAAAASGVRATGLLVLQQNLAASADPTARAQAVQDYLGRAGLDGMGALVRLLGVDRVALTTVDGARDTYLDEARALAFKHQEPIAADASNDELSARFREVLKLDEKLDRVRALTADDPLLTEASRAQALAEVDAARTALRDTLRTDHLRPAERLALVEQLERGWTTRWEQRAIEALEPAAASGL